MKFLIVIPARGGSKGIPEKNIKSLCGKPLIAYTIEAARRSKFKKESDIMVSTDNLKIATIAQRYGCSVPFLRPKRLATDKALSIGAVLHAIKEMEKLQECRYQYVILLQPTSPLRTSKHLDEAIRCLGKKKSDAVLSVVPTHAVPKLLRKINKKGYLEKVTQSQGPMRRQDMENIYALNGAIYICQREFLVKRRIFSGSRVMPYIMNRLSSVDIDTLEDFQLAELILKRKRRK